MSKIYELYALEKLEEMHAEEMPVDIWLPYVQLESERFVCRETGEVWERFEGVTVYMEDEDYPEGDLIEENERVQEGFVCWQGKKGEVPEAGDVFRVLDEKREVVFEEVISGEERLYGWKYASAVKEGEFARDLLLDMEQALKGGFGDSFGNNLLNYVELENRSHMDEIKNEEKILFNMRGIPFVMIVDEREVYTPCKLTFYEADGMHIHSYERELAAGDKWFDVRYRAVHDTGPAMCVGWGIGSSRVAAEKVKSLLDSMLHYESLDGRIADAAKRAVGPADKQMERDSRALD